MCISVPERLLRASQRWPRGGEQAIKGAHRRLALMHHPDRNPGEPRAAEKFKEATEAYNF
jgi:DnaJ-class molecular chaperone